jgi:hypothetical protein
VFVHCRRRVTFCPDARRTRRLRSIQWPRASTATRCHSAGQSGPHRVPAVEGRTSAVLSESDARREQRRQGHTKSVSEVCLRISSRALRRCTPASARRWMMACLSATIAVRWESPLSFQAIYALCEGEDGQAAMAHDDDKRRFQNPSWSSALSSVAKCDAR